MVSGVEYVRDICKKRKIAISTLEKECGFANGYLNPKKVTKIPYDRAVLISNYLNVNINNILGVEAPEKEEPELNARDRRDIAKDLDRIMGEIANDEDSPLYYNGEPIAGNKLDLLRNAIEVALEDAKKKNKETYRPYKYKARPQKGKAPADGE
ncbi:XRE family transcriptional regulator [Lachnospiraceae bacterium 54-53]